MIDAEREVKGTHSIDEVESEAQKGRHDVRAHDTETLRTDKHASVVWRCQLGSVRRRVGEAHGRAEA